MYDAVIIVNDIVAQKSTAPVINLCCTGYQQQTFLLLGLGHCHRNEIYREIEALKVRTHDAIICSISKQFCIYGTRKLNDQVFAQPDFPFKFNAIKIRFSSDGNMTLTDFETTFRFDFCRKGIVVVVIVCQLDL